MQTKKETKEEVKPIRGTISDCVKIVVDDSVSKAYPSNLGYVYRCTFINHEWFDMNGPDGHTSLVVSEKDVGDGSILVETLNSLYVKIYRQPED
jgi:hypothetical protein